MNHQCNNEQIFSHHQDSNSLKPSLNDSNYKTVQNQMSNFENAQASGSALQTKESSPSLQFLDSVQGIKDNHLTKMNPVSSNRKNPAQKIKAIRAQRIHVNSNSRLKEDDDALTLQRNLSNGISESPMGVYHADTQIQLERDRFIPKGSITSNFWNATEDADGLSNAPSMFSPFKQGLSSDRWLVDTLASEDDNTERQWRRPYGLQSENRKGKRNSLIFNGQSDLQSYTERRREQNDKKNDALFNIKEDDNIAEFQYSTHGQQNTESQNRPEERRTRGNTASLENPSRSMGPPVEASASQTQVAEPNRTENSNQNMDAIAEENNSTERATETQIAARLDASLSLRRCLAFFVGMSLVSLSILFMISDDISYQVTFGILYASSFYYIIENLLRIYFTKRIEWKTREDALSLIDAVCCLLLLSFFELKIAELSDVTIIMVIPFAFTTFAYFFWSKAPNPTKNRKIFIKFTMAFQVFFLTGKIDRLIDIDWRLTVGICWLALGIIGLYLIAYSLILSLAIIFGIFRQRLFENIGIGLQFIGLFWYLVFYGLSVPGFISMVGIAQAYQELKSFALLKLAAYVGLAMSGFMALYTIVFFKYIVAFMELFHGIETNTTDIYSPIEFTKLKGAVSLQVEKKESYFVMLSSTYFLPMDQKFFTKNEEKLKKIKDTILGFRLWKPRVRQEESMQLTNAGEPVDIQVLKQYKEDLDGKFTRIANQNHEEQLTSRTLRSSRQRVAIQKPVKIIINNPRGLDGSCDNAEAIKSSRRLNLSADDIDFKIHIESKRESQVQKKEENLCYLCFDNPPNAVLMQCGHGGICYSCASELVQKKNECMECRRPVDVIYKIDPNPKMTDIIKGVEICKVEMS